MNEDYNSLVNPVVKAAERYLDDPTNMARFRSSLLRAMRDPAYVVHRKRFDWSRFAREFTASDFEPPLETLTFFSFMLSPHFLGSWFFLPRNRIWWLIRLVEDVPYPLFWLQQRQLQGGHRELSRIAKKLDCFAVTKQHLYLYLYRHKPPIPKQFQLKDIRLLVLMATQPFGMWGLQYYQTKSRLSKKVVFCEPLDSFYRYQKVRPGEQPLQPKVNALLAKNSFEPEVTLFYSGRPINRHTGRIIWGGLRLGQEKQIADLTSGPMLVQEWDEDGWPMGYRVPLE